MADIDIMALNASTTIGGAIFKKLSPSGSGTGQYNTFLAISDNDGTERGFNSDDTNPLNATNNNIDVSKTHTVLLGSIPVKIIDGVAYYEFHVDLNESNNVPSAQISLDAFKIYTSGNAGIEDLTVLQSQNLAYNMDAGGDVTLLLSDASSSGSGNDDYAVLVPVANFAGQNPATTYLYLYVEMGFKGGDYAVNGTFEEWNVEHAGTLTGIKFSDVNSDGVRDQDGADNILGTADDEVGVGGVTIFIDANKDGIFDSQTERSTVTNADGSYSFAGVAVGTHQIDEVVPAGSTQTTGAFETATIGSVGQTVVVDPIGNHYPIPHIAIDKAFVNVTDGPDSGSSTTVIDGAGDIANYTVAVTNDGETGLVDVQVTDALADGGVVTGVLNGAFNIGDGNTNGVLDVGETWRYTVQQTATQADLDTNGGGDGDKDNSATVVATQQGVPTKQVTATDAASAPIVPAPSIAIDKTFVKWADDGAAGNAAGDIALYTVKVTNTGNVTLTNVTVVDPLTGQNISGVTLAPGASQTYNTSYTLTQADLDNNGGGDGDIDNTATADSDQTGSVNDSAEAPIAPAPSIAIDKSFVKWADDGAAGNAAGDVALYTVKVTNTGNVTLTNVTVVDPLTGQNISGVTLAPGASQTYNTSYTLTQADLDNNGGGDGDIDNTATADSDQTGSVNDSAEAPITPAPSIAIDKSFVKWADDGAAGNAAGDIALYTVKVTNTGNVTLTNVTVVDPLTGQNISGVTLAPGASQTYNTSYTLTQADLDNNGGGDGDIDNTATADSDQTGSVNDSAEAPIAPAPSIAIDKSFVKWADDGAAGNAAGDVALYTVKVTNTGNVTLTNVTVVDPLTGQNISGVTLAPGASQTYNTSYTLTQADLDNNGGGDGDIDNTATADSDQTGSVNDSAEAPIAPAPSIAIDKSFVKWADDGAAGNAAGDVALYTVKVTNTGNVTLTNVTVVDPLTGQNISGVTLAPGASQTYNTSYTLTQADLDNNGGGDGDIDNTATADSDQTGSVNDSAEAPIAPAPSIAIDKSFVKWADDGAAGNAAGDVALYTVKVTNTGNVTLTNVTVVDPLTGQNISGVTLAPGASQTYNTSYTLTQADLDNNGGGDGDIDNTATADSDQTGAVNDSAEAPIAPAPSIDLEKFVSVDGGATYDDADLANGLQNVNIGAPVSFMITVANTGNVSLTDVQITDVNKTGGLPGVPIDLSGVTIVESGAANHILDVGETWTLSYTQPFDAGVHLNTASVTTAQGVGDTDDAYYFSLVNEGPGVRTPGFWSNLGFTFWDGIQGNEPKQAGTPGFADGELLYKVDSDGDGDIDASDKAGLLVGDYDHDGKTGAGEDTLFINLKDAQTLINASNKQMSDGVYKLGRDVVATWLNSLAGNNIGDASDTQSPKHYIDDAIDWLQKFAGTTNFADETKDVFKFGAAVKTSTSSWSAPNSPIDHSASDMHNALDHYNNDGTTSDGGTVYGHDADSSLFVTALTIAKTAPALFAAGQGGEDISSSGMLTAQQYIA